jgi:hypothetical protein
VLQYATTPRSGHSIFDQNLSHNTWNGPIAGPVGGKYHAFVPLCGTGRPTPIPSFPPTFQFFVKSEAA